MIVIKDRVEGHVTWEAGYCDITITIDIYLEVKKILRGGLSRSKLLDYYHRGRRWSLLIKLSLISVFVLSHIIDMIIYVFLLLFLVLP